MIVAIIFRDDHRNDESDSNDLAIVFFCKTKSRKPNRQCQFSVVVVVFIVMMNNIYRSTWYDHVKRNLNDFTQRSYNFIKEKCHDSANSINGISPVTRKNDINYDSDVYDSHNKEKVSVIIWTFHMWRTSHQYERKWNQIFKIYFFNIENFRTYFQLQKYLQEKKIDMNNFDDNESDIVRKYIYVRYSTNENSNFDNDRKITTKDR